MGLLGILTAWWVLPELRNVYKQMSTFHKLMFLFMHFFDKYWGWYNTPVFVGLIYLEFRRTLHQKYNLIAVGNARIVSRSNPVQNLHALRCVSGKYNYSTAGGPSEADTFFGRNVMPQVQTDKLLDPHPSVVAAKLLNRKELQDYKKQFNMLAASWINFMIHDWIDHLEDTEETEEIIAPSSVASQCPLKKFKYYPTKQFPAAKGMIGHVNTRTPWWDASVIYGSTAEAKDHVRSKKDGKLRIGANGWLAVDNQNELPVAGDIRNLWLGVSSLQSLFIAEHNAVCDVIKKEHPEYSDEQLYQRAKLVTAAVLAKIHTIDWTTQLLKNNVLLAAMRINWYGILGKWFKDTFGKTPISLLSGLVGMKEPNDHGVPYSLTEEFTSVYRLHPLLPDHIDIKNIKAVASDQTSTPPTVEKLEIPELLGARGEALAATRLGLKTMLTSLGHQSAGALTLFNYPMWIRNVIPQNPDGTDRDTPIDMASLEIYRDRERSVCRYNEFRRRMLMPAIKKWEDLTDDKASIAAIRDVYGNDIESLDLLIGLLVEKKIKGFAISETAFFIFVIMASRRLEADRFFTSEFNEQVYTKVGFKWVNTTEGLKDVLRRHHPELVGDWMSATSAFSVWNQTPDAPNYWPLYLRWGTSQ